MRQANPIKSRLPAIFTDLLLVSLLPLWHNVYDLTPAYDLLNTSLHIPNEQSRTVLDLFKDEDDFKTPFYEANGFYGAPDFMEFARRIGVVESRARRFIKQAVDSVPAMEEMLDRSFMSEKSKAKYKENIRDRAKALSL